MKEDECTSTGKPVHFV